jgi:shikimate kinase
MSERRGIRVVKPVKPPGLRLALIGYRGTGKTTIARLLAQRCACDWYDADLELERQAGTTIRSVFAAEGEQGFRDREAAVLADLVQRSNCVLALGGGAVLRPANRQALRALVVVWLTATPETICRRLACDPSTHERRPPLTSAGGIEEIESLLASREPLYKECADWTVSTDGKTPQQVADEIVAWLDGGTKGTNGTYGTNGTNGTSETDRTRAPD